MAAVDYFCQPFYFDMEDVSMLEPLPYDDSDSCDTGLELSLSNIVLDGNTIASATSSSTFQNTNTIINNNNGNGNNNNITVKKRPRVSFLESPTLITVPSFACLEEDQRRVLWYRPVEIERFRTSARDACRKLREDPDAFPEDITRGLELRTSLDRQWRKHLARNCILKAQVRFPHIDGDHLASIAERCTALPREEALTQATRDYCSVYHPDWRSFVSQHSSSSTSSSSTVPSVGDTVELPLHFQMLAQNQQQKENQPPQPESPQRKRPSLDLDKEDENNDDDSSSSWAAGDQRHPQDGGGGEYELRIHDRMAKRYRTMTESEECMMDDTEECLFADLDFEIEL